MGVISLDRCALFPAFVPEGYDVKELPGDTVVHEIVNPPEIEPTDGLGSGSLDLSSDSGLNDQDRQGGLNVFSDCARCRGAVLGPPFGSLSDLPLGARLDSDYEHRT